MTKFIEFTEKDVSKRSRKVCFNKSKIIKFNNTTRGVKIYYSTSGGCLDCCVEESYDEVKAMLGMDTCKF